MKLVVKKLFVKVLTDISNLKAFKSRCDLYVIRKDTASGTSVSITVPGRAGAAYDRLQIWAFANLNGTPEYGVITTSSDSSGGSLAAAWTGNTTHTCTYANSGSDRVITISGLKSWGSVVVMSTTRIT